MYQLLSQVAGRAGRAEKPGVVYVQTWKPDHPAIRCAKNHDFRAFAKHELVNREMLHYPPYSRMVVFQFKGPSLPKVQTVADSFCKAMRGVSGEDAVMGPSPSVIEWMSGQYQWEANIKLSRKFNAHAVEKLMNDIFDRYDAIKPKGSGAVRINVDVDAGSGQLQRAQGEPSEGDAAVAQFDGACDVLARRPGELHAVGN